MKKKYTYIYIYIISCIYIYTYNHIRIIICIDNWPVKMFLATVEATPPAPRHLCRSQLGKRCTLQSPPEKKTNVQMGKQKKERDRNGQCTSMYLNVVIWETFLNWARGPKKHYRTSEGSFSLRNKVVQSTVSVEFFPFVLKNEGNSLHDKHKMTE